MESLKDLESLRDGVINAGLVVSFSPFIVSIFLFLFFHWENQ